MALWNRYGKSPEDRFWEKVHKKDADECWEWKGLLSKKGYGVMKVDNENMSTHRYSWILHFGQIPSGLYVCHSCDNRKCCNPNHLFLGTQLDNMQDMISKGRGADVKGEKNPRARIQDKDVIVIRELWDSGFSSRELSKKFNLPKGTVNKIVSNETWKHLPKTKRPTTLGGTKLNTFDIHNMKMMYQAGISQQEIASNYGIKQPQVSRIIRGESWKHE